MATWLYFGYEFFGFFEFFFFLGILGIREFICFRFTVGLFSIRNNDFIFVFIWVLFSVWRLSLIGKLSVYFCFVGLENIFRELGISTSVYIVGR